MSQTELLAIWGAVTGSIGTFAGLLGLWLRFRQHGLDKPKLLCEASFDFEVPSHAKHRITIRSVGRRPVSIDKVCYFMAPRDWNEKLICWWHHKNGRWLWNQEAPKGIKLNEGEKTEIGISLPKGLAITEINKVSVIDQAGNFWPVKWPSMSSLKKVATQEELDSFVLENEKRIVSATGYRLGEKYYLETNFDTNPHRTVGPCGRGFWLHNKRQYLDKFRDVKDIQAPNFLAGVIEGVE
jgi:hypothetical protein